MELETEHVKSAFELSEEQKDRLLEAVAAMWRIALVKRLTSSLCPF